MGQIHEITETNIFVPLDVRIGMQIVFIEYCCQRRHLDLNRCLNGQTMDDNCFDYSTFKACI